MSYALITVFVLGSFGAFVTSAALLRYRRLERKRGIPRAEFIRTFTDKGVPFEIPAAVYDCYRSRVHGVAPDDDYERTLSEGDEDIDDDSELLMKKLGLGIPPDYTPMRLDAPVVKTVGDMVLWLDWVRQHQPA